MGREIEVRRWTRRCTIGITLSLAVALGPGAACCLAPSKPVAPNMRCTDGVCECRSGFADCNNDTSDGCEIPTLSDASNCGGCGYVCDQRPCVESSCGAGKWVPPRHTNASFGDGGPVVVLAIERLLLGKANDDLSLNEDAWRQQGYDLDGLATTEDLAGHCQPQAGAEPASLVDGADGIDNGLHCFLELWMALSATPNSVGVTDSIHAGEFTYLLRIDGLGLETDYQSLSTNWYEAQMPEGAPPPAFDGNNGWWAAPASLGPQKSLDHTLVQFNNSYVTDHTWVSMPRHSIALVLKSVNYTMVLTLHHAVITVELTPERTQGLNGVIAGLVDTDELVHQFQEFFVASFDEQFCEDESFGPTEQSLRQCSDSLADGTQDPNRTCDAISVGIRFEAVAAHLAGIGEEEPPLVDHCPKAATSRMPARGQLYRPTSTSGGAHPLGRAGAWWPRRLPGPPLMAR